MHRSHSRNVYKVANKNAARSLQDLSSSFHPGKVFLYNSYTVLVQSLWMGWQKDAFLEVPSTCIMSWFCHSMGWAWCDTDWNLRHINHWLNVIYVPYGKCGPPPNSFHIHEEHPILVYVLSIWKEVFQFYFTAWVCLHNLHCQETPPSTY